MRPNLADRHRTRVRAFSLVLPLVTALLLIPQTGLAAEKAKRVKIPVLVVLYTRSFTRTLRSDELACVYQADVPRAKWWYAHTTRDLADFEFDLLEIDRSLGADEIGHDEKGGYYYDPGQTLERDLAAHSIPRNHYADVIVIYAWQNRPYAWQMYGGGAIGPDPESKIAGDPGKAGFNSIAILPPPKEASVEDQGLTWVMVHEFHHNMDAMFWMRGMSDEVPGADGIEGDHAMKPFLKERPGPLMPRVTDDQILSIPVNERFGRYATLLAKTYEWSLQRPGLEKWLKLAPQYGSLIPGPPPGPRLTPGVSQIIAPAGDQVWLTALLSDPQGQPIANQDVTATMGDKEIALNYLRATIQWGGDKDPERPPYDYLVAIYQAPVTMPREPQDVTISTTVGASHLKTTVRLTPLHTAMIAAPGELLAYANRGEKLAVSARVVQERFQGGRGLDNAQVEARLEQGGKEIETISLSRSPLGIYRGTLTKDIPVGTYRMLVSAKAPGVEVQPHEIRCVNKYDWNLVVDERKTYTGSEGSRLEIPVKITADEGTPPEVELIAEAAGNSGAAEQAPDGSMRLVFADLPAGEYQINLTARQAGTQYALSASLPAVVAPAGVTYLSDLKWEKATTGWGRVGQDRSCDDRPLTLGGKRVLKGLGVHADSEVVFQLDGTYSTFQAEVGVDGETGGQGSVVFVVVADGQEVYRSPVIKGGEAPVPVSVALSSAKELRIIVSNGGDDNSSDHADWGGARLIK